MNSLSWEDSRLAASPGRSVTLHRRVNAGTPHESVLDMAFRVSVCLGHEESGLTPYEASRSASRPGRRARPQPGNPDRVGIAGGELSVLLPNLYNNPAPVGATTFGPGTGSMR